MTDFPQEMRELLREEGLDDIDSLLTPREWDEVPLASRLSRLAFMAHLDVREQSRILVSAAVNHLDTILGFVAKSPRPDAVVMLSIFDWEELDSSELAPVVPNFWISTNPGRDLVKFRLQLGSTIEARELRSWLENASLHVEHEVFESASLSPDPELRRLYIAKRDCAFLARMQEAGPGRQVEGST